MAIDMKTRRALIADGAVRYGKASKAEKRRILDDLVAWTGCERSALARALRRAGALGKTGKWGGARGGSGRKPVYRGEVMEPLRRVWAILSFPCGKRLVSQMSEMLSVLTRYGELRVGTKVRAQLESMSASTADRLLGPERRKMELKGRHGTKPGYLLRHQIPIRTFADWDDARPGFTEMDLVSHEGGDASGDFCYTLTLTDVATGWTQCRAVRNRAQKWTFEALKHLRKRLPFPLLGVDSDNGSEFINHHLVSYCQEEHLTFTRARPYRKNDNCFVEQKNYTAVRQMVGYYRYDTEDERVLLNRIYALHRLYFNFFLPQMKLVEKTRVGSKVIKRYDDPKTPYQRVLDASHIKESIKNQLKDHYASINPAALRRQISKLQQQLQALVVAKESQRIDHLFDEHVFEGTLITRQ